MGEISQTKTSIECSLYSPRAQTHSHTQFNRSSSRQSAKRLLLALWRLISNALFVIVAFPAVHPRCWAMSPSSHWEQWRFLVGPCSSVQQSKNWYLKFHTGFWLFFPAIIYANSGFFCLLAPPVHLPSVIQFFWTWSQIFLSHLSHFAATRTQSIGILRRIFPETKLQQADTVCGCFKGPKMNWEEDRGTDETKSGVEENVLLRGWGGGGC